MSLNIDSYFYTASTARLSIANGGNVGIGTTSPTNNLHVVGGATFASGSAGANQVVVWTPGSASWSSFFREARDEDTLACHPKSGAVPGAPCAEFYCFTAR